MKYILGIFGVFVVIILAIILFRGGDNTRPVTTGKKAIILTDYSQRSQAEARLTIDGPINAEELHRAIQISVTPSFRTIKIIRGYQNQVLKEQVLPNNQDAFSQFIHALSHENFAALKGGDSRVNPTAVCPTGTRYTYELFDNQERLLRTWSATCNAGTFGGDAPTTRLLFQAQIPGYSQFTTGVNTTSINLAATN